MLDYKPFELRRHGLMIAVKKSEWKVLDQEGFCYDEIAADYGDLGEYKNSNMALMCILEHTRTGA